MPSSLGDIQENIMTLKVYNVLSRETKTVNINLPDESEDSPKISLGILVREEEYPTAHERVLRIAEVYPKSPASFAGLMPLNDYIIDSPQYPFVTLEQFAGIVQAIEEKRDPKGLELCIYNAKTNSTRLTKIYPNKRWGGKGALGCEFSLGFLNFLPQVQDEEDIVIPRVNSPEMNGNHYEFEKINVVTIDDSYNNNNNDDAKGNKNIAADEEKSKKYIGEILQEKDQVTAKDKSPTASTSYQNLLIETGNDSKNSLDHHPDEQTTPIFELRSMSKDPTEDHIIEEHTSPDFPNRAFIKSPTDSFDASRSQIQIKPESSKPNTPKMSQPNHHYHQNVQVQKSSIRAMPRPQVRSRNTEASISHSISGISDISPITKDHHHHSSFNKKFFSTPGVHQRSTSFSGIHGISSPPSPHNLNSTIKEEVSVFYQSQSIPTAKKPRRHTSDNKSHPNAKNQDEDIVETYFQGFERVEHLEDEPQGFPKILMINTQEQTNITTTVLDKSGVESVNKSFDIMDTYEKPICKTVIQYAFQSKKLGGEYIIKSTDLFNIEDFKKL